VAVWKYEDNSGRGQHDKVMKSSAKLKNMYYNWTALPSQTHTLVKELARW
jgi:hypothetical protein